jgi:hypothetical protein
MNAIAQLTVHAGHHERLWCPVETELELEAAVDLERLVLWDTTDGAAVPVQAWRVEDGKVALSWVLVAMRPGEARTYELRLAQDVAPTLADGVHLQEVGPGQLEILVGGAPFAMYNFGPDVVRPYFYPIMADPGIGITRNWPMVEGVEGETRDHVHHKGVYTAQGEVNGVDNWAEGAGHGYQVHRTFTRLYGGPAAGGFTEELAWTDADRQPNMTETRRLAFYATPRQARLFDYQVTLHASEGEVTLGDTKEGGLLSIRVASSMDAGNPDGGRIVNGCGGIQEGETWGKRAPWCDYSGPIAPSGGDRDDASSGRLWYGVTLIDDETNPRHPTYWHVRDYGLMTANCFGVHDFRREPDRRWPLIIPAGESRTWRYRVLIHHGDADEARVDVHYHAFAHPPTIKATRV